MELKKKNDLFFYTKLLGNQPDDPQRLCENWQGSWTQLI